MTATEAAPLLTGTLIDNRRMPGGWTATVEQLKPGKWEVRVYDPLGEVGFIDSTLPTRESAFATAHREAWGEYAEGLVDGSRQNA
jgi:hypothetical protein